MKTKTVREIGIGILGFGLGLLMGIVNPLARNEIEIQNQISEPETSSEIQIEIPQNQPYRIEPIVPNKAWLLVEEDKMMGENSTGSEIEIEMVEEVEVGVEVPIIVEPTPAVVEDERHILISIVAGEANGEPYLGKVAVAQCLYDGMIRSGVDAAGVRTAYQYSGWNPGLEFSNPEQWQECVDAVAQVFDDGIMATEEFIVWFYNPNICSSPWHESQKYVEIEGVGQHRFFAPWDW